MFNIFETYTDLIEQFATAKIWINVKYFLFTVTSRVNLQDHWEEKKMFAQIFLMYEFIVQEIENCKNKVFGNTFVYPRYVMDLRNISVAQKISVLHEMHKMEGQKHPYCN